MRTIKAGSLDLSVIGLGAWQIGSDYWGWGAEFGPDNVRDLLDAAQDVGITLIDTAEVYGQGESERQLGFHLSSGREQFVLASKVSPWHLTASRVYDAAVRSIQRIQRSDIDLYQIHFPNPVIPLTRTMSGMRKLRNEGKIKEVGVSNFSMKRWMRSEMALGSPVVTNQVVFSLLSPGAFDSLKSMLNEGHAMIAYSPMAMGLLSGKYSAKVGPTGSRSNHYAFSQRNSRNVRRVLEVVESVAKSHDALVSQIALAWVIGHPNVIAIPGAKSAEQVRQNADSAQIQLSKSEMSALDEVSSAYSPAAHIPSRFEALRWLFSR